MEILNIRVEVPSTGVFDVKELEHRLTEYAKRIVCGRTISEPAHDVESIYISPLIRELETGFICPENISHDKEELSQLRAERYL